MNRRDFAKISSLAALGLAMPRGFDARGMSKKKIKIGMIGTTHSHASEKIKTIFGLSQLFQLVGVAEVDSKKQKSAAESLDFKGVEWITKEELLGLDDLDAVIIESSMDHVLNDVMDCVKAGKHIHIDNPPGRSLPLFEDVLIEVEGRGLAFQLGYFTRYNKAVQKVKEIINEGLIGKIFEVEGTFSKKISDERRNDITEYYGGAMLFLGCYLIELVVSIFGEPDRITTFRKKTFPDLDNLYDNELSVLEYKNVTASLRSSVLETYGVERRHISFVGTEGTVEINPFEPGKVFLTLNEPKKNYLKGKNQIQLPEQRDRYTEQLIDFAGMIRKERPLYYPFAKELEIQRALLTAANYY
jgi:predicted dehydrogenase